MQAKERKFQIMQWLSQNPAGKGFTAAWQDTPMAENLL